MVCRNVAVWISNEKENTVSVVGRYIDALKNRQMSVKALQHNVDCYDIQTIDDLKSEDIDLILAFGGDGTILDTIKAAVEKDIPVLGVNLGHMGFLSGAQPADHETVADILESGMYTIEERMVLECIDADGEKQLALNDITLSRDGRDSGIADIRIYADGIPVDRVKGDGVIISTPTGSTAYALAAGGPIIYPETKCILIDPVCPHSIHSRPIILPPEMMIELEYSAERMACAAYIDGRRIDMTGNRISVSVSRGSMKFLKVKNMDFFNILREKFADWSI